MTPGRLKGVCLCVWLLPYHMVSWTTVFKWTILRFGKKTTVGAHFLYLTMVQGFATLRTFKNSDTRSIWEVKRIKINNVELNSFFFFLFTSPWISSAKEQVEKSSGIQGQVRCSSQDTVCIKCGDKKVFLPPDECQ